jgi:hypothetical protein
VFADGGAERGELLDRWMTMAADGQLPAFVDLAEGMVPYVDDIKHSLAHHLTNARVDDRNQEVQAGQRVAVPVERGVTVTPSRVFPRRFAGGQGSDRGDV